MADTHLGTVTATATAGLSVQLDSQEGYSVGPLPSNVADRAYAVGDRVTVGELAGGEYVVLGRLH
jgi:hypothetical protein